MKVKINYEVAEKIVSIIHNNQYREVLFKTLNKIESELDDDFSNMLYLLLARIIYEKNNLILELKTKVT